MDKLEKYILENREAFDDQTPGPSVWQGIEAAIPARSEPARRVSLNWWKYAAVAAVALVLVLSGFIGGIYLRPAGFDQSDEYAEFLKAEQYYSSQIHQKLNKINNMPHDAELEKDLEQIDTVFRELKAAIESGDTPNREQLMHALILTYQTKVSILERVIDRMQESDKQLKTEEYEGNLEI